MNQRDNKMKSVRIENWPKDYVRKIIGGLSVFVAFISVFIAFEASERSNKQVRLSRKAFVVPSLIKDSKNREYVQLENVTNNAALNVEFLIQVRSGKDFETVWSETSKFVIPGRQKRLFYLEGKPQAYAVKNIFGIWETNRALFFRIKFSDYADPSYDMTRNDTPINLYRYYKSVKSEDIDLHLVMNLKDITP